MEKKTIVTIGAIAAIAGGAFFAGEEKDIKQQAKQDVVHPTKAAKLIDGGVIFVRQIDRTDGGVEHFIVKSPYYRRPAGKTRCYLPDGGMAPAWNRMIGLTGPDCQNVAESVYAGQDPEKEF